MFDEIDERVHWQRIELSSEERFTPSVSQADAYTQTTSVGDYFRPENIHKRNTLVIGASAIYTAEGKLKFPSLTDKEYSFTFGLPNHFEREQSNWWVLQIRDFRKVFNSRFPKEVVRQMLEELEHNPAQLYSYARGVSKRLNQLVKPIEENIKHRFLGDGSSEGYRTVRQRIQDIQTNGYADAKMRYEPELERQLQEWHLGKEIHPKLYTYSIVDTRLILDL